MQALKKIGIPLLTILLAAALCGCQSEAPSAETSPTAQVTATPAPTAQPTPVSNDPIPLVLPVELTDGNTATWVGGDIVLSAEERLIGSLYLTWNTVPGPWKLYADGKELSFGDNGYLHEYIELDSPAQQVILRADAALCEISAFEKGAQLPDWVQRWEPTLDRADLLLLPTHADDEHIFFGGMMPYYGVERGLKVQVAYLTNHWAQAQRPHELLDGLWTVGIRSYPVIGPFADKWADSLQEAEELYTREAAVNFTVEMLRRFKPTVVIGHDLMGEYGHGVHCLNARALCDAVELSHNAAYHPVSAEIYGVWDVPKTYLHLYPENEIIMDWNQPLASFQGKTALEVAAEGFSKHLTQQGFFHVYGEGEDWDSRRFGLYRSTVGPDVVGGDVFENITSYY